MSRHCPDLCLLDISLGEASGLDLLPRLKKAHPSCRIAVHSMFARLDYLQQALRSGASGYFIKQSTPDVLINGLDLISRGGFFFDRYMTELMLPELTRRIVNIIETHNEEYDILSHREQEVFRLLAERHTNRAIASVLYISHRTVENYKSAIMKKLGLNS